MDRNKARVFSLIFPDDVRMPLFFLLQPLGANIYRVLFLILIVLSFLIDDGICIVLPLWFSHRCLYLGEVTTALRDESYYSSSKNSILEKADMELVVPMMAKAMMIIIALKR